MANFGDGLQVDTGVQKILIVITVLPRSLPPSAHARSQVEGRGTKWALLRPRCGDHKIAD